MLFHSRPRSSQLAATVSNQSKVVENKPTLDKLFEVKNQEFLDKEIPLRENWGGYLVVPTLFEFWQGRKVACTIEFNIQKRIATIGKWNV